MQAPGNRRAASAVVMIYEKTYTVGTSRREIIQPAEFILLGPIRDRESEDSTSLKFQMNFFSLPLSFSLIRLAELSVCLPVSFSESFGFSKLASLNVIRR